MSAAQVYLANYLQEKEKQRQATELAKAQEMLQPKTSDIIKQLAALFGAAYLGKAGANLADKTNLLSSLGLSDGQGGLGLVGKGSLVSDAADYIGSLGSDARDYIGNLFSGGGGTSGASLGAGAAAQLPVGGLETAYKAAASQGGLPALPGGIEDYLGSEVMGPGAGEGLSALGQALSLAAVAHGGYNLAKGFGEGDWKSGAMSGAEIASGLYPFIGPWSLAAIPIGAGLGLAKTGKTNEATSRRDDIRRFLFEKGVSPEAGKLSLPGGGTFDIAKEGGGKGAYQVDFNQPLAGKAVGLLNPLGEIITSGAENAGQSTGQFSNAALQGAGSDEQLLKNIQFQYKQAGVTHDEAKRAMNRLSMAGRITPQEYDAYMNSINKVFAT